MLVFDGTENPVGLLTNSATVSFAYKYDPWGVQTLTAGGTGNGAGQNPYAFHAGIKDPGSGMVKFGQRWYNPTTGTSTQQDTLDNPLDPANANRYAYAGDDPINNLDPSEALSSTYGGALIFAGAAVIGLITATVFLRGGLATVGLAAGSLITLGYILGVAGTVYSVGTALTGCSGSWVLLINSTVFLTIALLVFVAIFATFVFFSDNVPLKLVMCSFAGIFAIAAAVQLLRVTRRRSQ